MNKIVDRITNLNDLDEFTTYILNPESEDSIIAINDPKDFETEKLFISVDRNVAKVTFERLHDIVMGNLEYVAETNKITIDTSPDEIEAMLFGKDKRTKIVNIAIKDDQFYIFYVDGREEILPCVFWALSEKNLDGRMKKLEGNCFYKYRKTFSREEDLKSFKKRYYQSIYSPADLVAQQLSYYGITLYKDLNFEELNCLAFDIETDSTQQTKNSKVFTISCTHFQNDKSEVVQFVLNDFENQAEMLQSFCEYVKEINPSIITGHNIIGFDIPYLNHVANLNKTALILGRDGSEIEIASRTKDYRVDGSQTWTYRDINIFGRDIVDGMYLAVKYDVGRNFPSWGLKPIIEYLGLIEEGRQFYDASKIGENWNDPVEREKIIEYCKDDGNDSKAIFSLMARSYFYMARSIPRTFQGIINSATGGWLNDIIVRAYLQNGHSIAKADESSKVTGGISFGIPGRHANCWKIDVSSLYPSIMRQWHINDPNKDPKDVFFNLVNYNTIQRLNHKKLAKETKNNLYKDLEQSEKILINSAYGLLGTQRVNYNNFNNADFVTSVGRRILSLTMQWATGKDVNYWFQPEHTKGDEGYLNSEHDKQFEQYLTLKPHKPHNFVIVNGDTDSITIKKRDESEFTEQERIDLINEINDLLPELIKYEDDGYFPVMVVAKAKNYVLYDGKKIKYKGSSFKDAKKEPILKQLMKDVIENGLIHGTEDWVDIFNRYVEEAKNIKDMTQWASKKNITETLFTSDRLNETKVVDAIKDLNLKVGDKVLLYNAIDGLKQATSKGELLWTKMKKKEYTDLGLEMLPKLESCQHKDNVFCYDCNPHLCLPKMVPNEVLKSVDKFDGNYDVDHYIKRCYDTIEILSNVLDMERLNGS